MNLYLAGTMNGNMGHFVQMQDLRERESDSVIQLAILESYYYADEWTEWLIPRVSEFLLDSGAFTFMMNANAAVDWDEYLDGYIDFINRNDVKLFFELDIDSVVGYERVLEFRRKLENGTGKKCIPVWHVSRGADEFVKMCEEYDYVAFGGMLSDGVSNKKIIEALPWFIRTAHDHGAKIHGLGFTNLKQLGRLHFDSVDSTSWTSGNRFGHIWHFNGTTMEKFDVPKGKRITDSKGAAVNNFNEWVKFQDYARNHL